MRSFQLQIKVQAVLLFIQGFVFFFCFCFFGSAFEQIPTVGSNGPAAIWRWWKHFNFHPEVSKTNYTDQSVGGAVMVRFRERCLVSDLTWTPVHSSLVKVVNLTFHLTPSSTQLGTFSVWKAHHSTSCVEFTLRSALHTTDWTHEESAVSSPNRHRHIFEYICIRGNVRLSHTSPIISTSSCNNYKVTRISRQPHISFYPIWDAPWLHTLKTFIQLSLAATFLHTEHQHYSPSHQRLALAELADFLLAQSSHKWHRNN